MRPGYDEEWYTYGTFTDHAQAKLKLKLNTGTKVYVHNHSYNDKCSQSCEDFNKEKVNES